jgi:hypothetical protein
MLAGIGSPGTLQEVGERHQGTIRPEGTIAGAAQDHHWVVVAGSACRNTLL